MANLIFVPQDYPTIQEAIDHASDYDTIRVAPGTYNETITVNKTIQLLGAQAGVDARTRAGAQESIIAATGSRPFQVNADNAVIDGFTVQGNTLGNGISVGNVSGYWIFNNIIQNSALGLFLDPNSGTTTSQVRQNLFKDNIDPATNGGTGIFTHATNLFIDSNRFTGQREFASINLTTGSTNVIVSNNEILNDTSIALTGSTNIKIADNRILGTQGTAIFIGGDTTITEIEGNIIRGSTGNGISVNRVFASVPNRNIRAKDNAIEANQLAGLNVSAGSYDAVSPNRPLDATNNWWGSANGPNYNGTGPGTGQPITDPSLVVIYTPYLKANPLTPTSVVTPVQRLVSRPSSVYVSTDRNSAVLGAISGVGQLATQVSRFMWWPNLEKFANDNSPFGETANPVYVWDSTTSKSQSRGFAIASNPFPIAGTAQLVILLAAFADNALEAQIDLVEATAGTIVPSGQLGTLLMDGSMDPASGVTTDTSPPFNWQNVRFYSVTSDSLSTGTYRVVVSFQAVNYDQFPGLPDPAGLCFAADLYLAE